MISDNAFKIGQIIQKTTLSDEDMIYIFNNIYNHASDKALKSMKL